MVTSVLLVLRSELRIRVVHCVWRLVGPSHIQHLDLLCVLIEVLRDLHATFVLDKALQLLYPCLFLEHIVLSFHRYLVECVKFLLQLDDCLISLVESAGQGNHDVSLLEEELLVPVDLGLTFLELVSLALYFTQLDFILLSDDTLLLLKSRSELRGVLDLFTSCKHL